MVSNLSVVNTKDGSHTILNASINETYHSIGGALSESIHVYINNGLLSKLAEIKGVLNILEIGFGTGLNLALTYQETLKKDIIINYYTLEPEIISLDIINKLNYFKREKELYNKFLEIHNSKWNYSNSLNPNFNYYKDNNKLEDSELKINEYDLVYFDAFAQSKQSNIWEYKNFEKIYLSMKSEGILVTYAATGNLKRTLKSLGFRVKILNGAVGKREMTYAIKN